MTEEDNLMTNQAVSDQTTDAQAIAKTTPAVDVNGNVWRINHLTGEAVRWHICAKCRMKNASNSLMKLFKI